MKDNKKKLLIIGSSLNYGSPGKICENLGIMGQQSGWTVYQAHGLKYHRSSHLITKAVSSKWEERAHAIYSLLFDGHGLASSAGTLSLIKWVEEIDPDVIHLHNLHGYYLNYKILFDYLSTTTKPIIWTLHDFWPITGHCAHFDYIRCNKWKTHCFDCPQIHSYPKSLFWDGSRRNFDIKKKAFTSVKNMIIVPVSQWVGSVVKESFLAKYPIFPIYNGIDTSVFKPSSSHLRQKLGLEGKYVLLGVASPWYELKGLYDYFKLSKCLPIDYKIVMIGLSASQIQKLPSNILGVERTDNQKQLAEYYSMADLTLNLSYQETFGMTTIEGMACGTPGIVYNKTASPELISEETGRVVVPGNIADLLHAIQEICSLGKGKFTQACVKRVNENFEKNKQFQKYIDLYNTVIRK